MTIAAKLRLAADFAYTSDEEDAIARLFPPLSPSSAIFPASAIFRGMVESIAAFPHIRSPLEKTYVQLVEQFARDALADYASGRVDGSKAEETAELAARLQYLVKSDVLLYRHWPITEHLHALENDARKIAAKSGKQTTRVHDKVRANLASKILGLQRIATGEMPTKYGNGRAAQLLMAAIDPVMRYARHAMGIEAVAPLTADQAVSLIRQYASGDFDDLML